MPPGAGEREIFIGCPDKATPPRQSETRLRLVLYAHEAVCGFQSAQHAAARKLKVTSKSGRSGKDYATSHCREPDKSVHSSFT